MPEAGKSERRPRALVTGGAGFLGSHLCGWLLAEGYRVVCADNLRTGSLENVAHLADDPGFEYLDHDVTLPVEVRGSSTRSTTSPPPRAPWTSSASQSRS